jgi:hypothetical protein
MDAGIAKIEHAKTIQESQTAQQELLNTVQQKYNDLLDKAIQQRQKFVDLSKDTLAPGKKPVFGQDERENIEKVNRDIQILQQQAQVAIDKIKNARLTQTAEVLRANAANLKAESPYTNMLNKMKADLAGLQGELRATGQVNEVAARGEADYLKKVTELNDGLRLKGKALDLVQLYTIHGLALDTSRVQAEVETKKKIEETTRSLQERISAEQAFNSQNTGTYEERRTVFVQRQLADITKSAPLPIPPETLASIQKMITALYDLQNAARTASLVPELQNQIVLQNQLASSAGNYQRTHQAQLDAEIAKIRTVTNTTKERIEQEVAAYRELDAAKQRAQQAERGAGLNLEIGGVRRTTAAAFGGEDAIRAAALQNKLLEAFAKEGIYANLAEISQKAQAEYTERIVTAAAKLATEDADQLKTLQRELEVLKEVQGTEVARAEITDQILRKEVEIELKQRSAAAGMRAFFIEMQEQAKSAAVIVYDALNSALDKSSENLAKMLTEKKPKGGWGEAWGKEFQAVGTQVVQASIKSTLQTALGKAGSAFVKKDGSSPDAALWVRLAGTAGAGIPGVGTGPSSINVPTFHGAGGAPGGGLFGGGSQGGFIFSLLKMFGGGSVAAGTAAGGGESIGAMNMAITGLAEGGDMTPTNSYIVGERGFEIVKGLSGRVVNNAESRRILSGGGGTTVMYSIDARGAELGVENRIRQGIETSHRSAIATSVRASAERSKRMPAGGR